MGSTIKYPSFNPQPKGDPKPEKKQKPIPKKSAKQKTKDKEYNIVRKLFLDNRMMCEVKHLSDGSVLVCRHRSSEVHHKAGRDGYLNTDIRYFLAVCRGHHAYIEEHPSWAKEYGYSEDRTNK